MNFSKCPIIIGKLHIKLLLPFFLAITQIIIDVINEKYPEERHSMVPELNVISFGLMAVKLIPCILRMPGKDEDNANRPLKKKCLHYFWLVLIFHVYLGLKFGTSIAEGNLSKNTTQAINSVADGEFVKIGIELVFLAILTRIMLKYKYFLHHILATIFFIIFLVLSDISLDYYNEMKNKKIAVIILEFNIAIVDPIFYVYQKYMMEKLYYPYWNVAFVKGVIMFILSSLLLFNVLTNGENSEYGYIKSFYLYFREVNIGLIIGKLIIVFILYFFSGVLTILISYYLNPNFTLIAYHISKFISVLRTVPKEKYYLIVYFVMQFFCLMIYLEILELNFCNLNKNTKRLIEERGIEDLNGDLGRDSTISNTAIDINKDYFIKNTDSETKSEQPLIELNSQSNEKVSQRSIND